MTDNWHRNAIIYAVDVARFADGNNDGIGDFKGLTGKLDYLAQLGVTCLWLLPFFPSPWRDNGYDISNHYGIDPRLGSFDDFIDFLHGAGDHGLRVMVDLVINHTSDEHPWFFAARHDEQSRYRDYYIWSHSPPPTPPDKGPMFPGEESTVWTYDDIARAYYYHRFYHFQPGLNGANTEVQDEIERIMDFWVSFGVDGFRLDAASHFIEPKMTEASTPRDPHGILKGFYHALRERRPDAVLLTETDVLPQQIKAYWEGGDQMNLMLNFLLNNYIFLGLARGEAEPIVDALRALPTPPASGQWANLLRNLDEVDLERLSPEQRADVMRDFAPEEDMQIYGRGIRRRLAPMLHDERRLRLAFSLLFALPGAPLLVYGDEIGMGEDLRQPGRAAVRPPMQWTADQGGGFFEAAPGRYRQPAIADGPYGYRERNVESKTADADSLWHWVERLAYLRRSHPEFGNSDCQVLTVDHPAVLALGYDHGGGLTLVLHNLGADKAKIELDLKTHKSPELQNLLGGAPLRLDNGRARLEIKGYDCRWYQFDWS